VRWEEMTDAVPEKLIDWTGQEWTPGCGRKAAHPNARYTAPARQCPVIDPDWEKPEGVPISAIIFGGRRSTTVPLVYEALSWEHGVFLGSQCSSERTAAAEGKVGEVRLDPFAMLPFCGYNMGDYFGHWLEMGRMLGGNAPKVFMVNWFRKEGGKFLWPGFGENSRVLKWVCERLEGGGKATLTPIGYVPTADAIDVRGLVGVGAERMGKLVRVEAEEWLGEVGVIRSLYEGLEERLPQELRHQLTELEQRLHFAVTKVPTKNASLIGWVEEMKGVLEPQHVYWCDGSEEEYRMLCDLLVEGGTFTRLNPKKRPNSFYARSDPGDVVRGGGGVVVVELTGAGAG
jgi:phosphoenolpyruvate carboxykinase (GTP)